MAALLKCFAIRGATRKPRQFSARHCQRASIDCAEPARWQGHNDCADALYGQGKLEEAAAEYREALRLRNDVAQVRGSLVHTLTRLGRLDEAIVVSREGVRLRPDDVEARYALSRDLREAGRYDESLAEIKRARELALKNQVGRPASEERARRFERSGTL